MVRLQVTMSRQIGRPSLATTTAECSLWVLPRSSCRRSRAASTLSRLVVELAVQVQRLVRADHEARLGRATLGWP